jgi:hypothetical protein
MDRNVLLAGVRFALIKMDCSTGRDWTENAERCFPMQLCRLTALIVVFAYGGATQVHAGLVSYADFASWSAAVSDFETVTIPDLPNVYTPFPPFGPVFTTFTTENVTFSIRGFSSIWFDPPGLMVPGVGVGTTLTEITFPHAVTAFSMEFVAQDGWPVDVLLSNNAGLTLNPWGTVQPVYYLGVTDTAPFDTVLIQSDETILQLWNFAYAPPPAVTEPTAVPEPASLTLMAGLGIVGLVCGQFRRRRLP